MKWTPILFSAPMVRALLDGSKTQTRRIAPIRDLNILRHPGDMVTWGVRFLKAIKGVLGSHSGGKVSELQARHIIASQFNPYGQPGDRLWVRQEHYRFGHWEPAPGLRTKGNRQKWKFVADTEETLYEAPDKYRKGRHHKDAATPAWHKRLARFMPRRLSVIDLEVTAVRVERLQDISEADAMAEGVTKIRDACHVIKGFDYDLSGLCHTSAITPYANLWESINGPDSWDANPWVWVVEFKRIEGGAA